MQERKMARRCWTSTIKNVVAVFPPRILHGRRGQAPWHPVLGHSLQTDPLVCFYWGPQPSIGPSQIIQKPIKIYSNSYVMSHFEAGNGSVEDMTLLTRNSFFQDALEPEILPFWGVRAPMCLQKRSERLRKDHQKIAKVSDRFSKGVQKSSKRRLKGSRNVSKG